MLPQAVVLHFDGFAPLASTAATGRGASNYRPHLREKKALASTPIIPSAPLAIDWTVELVAAVQVLL